MLQEFTPGVTALLLRWKAGDRNALDELLPLVYNELEHIAHAHLRRERPGHTLQSAALLHEAYMRLLDQQPFDSADRCHFLSIASRLMRQILVDHARAHGAAKRGAGAAICLDVSVVLPQRRGLDLVAVDDALSDLARMDERQSRIVELRFFGGLSSEEVAQALGISLSTVKREWNVAKAWLTRALKRGAYDDSGAVGKN